MPMYHQVAVMFADLHDTAGRMQEKGCINVSNNRPFLVSPMTTKCSSAFHDTYRSVFASFMTSFTRKMSVEDSYCTFVYANSNNENVYDHLMDVSALKY